jgi:hypothetical protein
MNRRKLAQDRTAAANGLLAMVRRHPFAPGESLNIVAHSHGGNIVVEASKKIGHKIDILITLGTPVRDDYIPDKKNIGLWIQAYSPEDSVQVNGGYGGGFCYFQGECGPAGRQFSDATENLAFTRLGAPISAHSALWQSEDVWSTIIDHARDEAAEFCETFQNPAACGLAKQ